MTLAELKSAVDAAVELATDYTQDPTKIVVSLQIDSEDGYVVAGDNIEVGYDNDGLVSGCVISGWNYTAGREE